MSDPRTDGKLHSLCRWAARVSTDLVYTEERQDKSFSALGDNHLLPSTLDMEKERRSGGRENRLISLIDRMVGYRTVGAARLFGSNLIRAGSGTKRKSRMLLGDVVVVPR